MYNIRPVSDLRNKYTEIEDNRDCFVREGLLNDSNFYRFITSRIVKEIGCLNDVSVLRQMQKDLPRDISGRPG